MASGRQVLQCSWAAITMTAQEKCLVGRNNILNNIGDGIAAYIRYKLISDGMLSFVRNLSFVWTSRPSLNEI